MASLANWSAHGALDLLDAAYDLEASPTDWVRRVAAAAADALDAAAGLQAFEFDLAAVDGRRFGEPVLVGGTEAWQEVWRANWWEPIIVAMEPEAFEGLVRFGPTSVTSALFVAVQRAIPSFRALLEQRGHEGWGERLPIATPARPADKLYYPDSWNVVGLDASGRGVALVANRTERVTRAADAEVQISERVAAHLAAAVRLRASLRAHGTRPGAEAVLDTHGRVVHAEGPARDACVRAALRDAVATIDRLRTHRKGAHAKDALETWRALHEGRYSLVEEFESDGRRFVLARPNAPEPASLDVLTPRERQVVSVLATGCANKIVAYELGVTTSTVAALLRRAMRKLGVRTRAELIRRVRAATPPRTND